MYPGKTLYEIIFDMDNKSIPLIDVLGKTVPHLNSTLNHKMKEATSAGVGIETTQANVVSKEQDSLWEKGDFREQFSGNPA